MTQSQTVQGDNEEEEEDPNPRQKGKERERERRFTIKPGDLQNDFVLLESDPDPNKQEVILNTIKTTQAFTKSVQERPEDWYDTIRATLTNMQALHDQAADLIDRVQDSKEEANNLKRQISQKNDLLKTSQNDLKTSRDKAKRLRTLRDEYRNKADNRAEEIETLQAKFNSLQDQLKAQTKPTPEEEIRAEDSDVENHRPIRRMIRQNTSNAAKAPQVPTVNSHQGRHNTPATHTTQERHHTPFTTRSATNTNASRPKSNNKYPDIDNFHSTEGSKAQDAWEAHLRSKFRHSQELFEDEQSKIDYIRDHYKGITFNIVKARAVKTAVNPYLTAEEPISDLNQMFGEVDREARAEAELQNPKFAIGVSDPKETFPAFFVQFTLVIAPLSLTDY